MNYLDLFSGIGGFSLGFQRAGWHFDKHYFSEINKYATSIYQKQFPDAVGLGSITGINPEELGKIDLITFGFPCQDLSIAGKRAGLGGSRSGLFFEAMRIIRNLRPSIFIFENVKGLLTSNGGQDFETVLREIADIGLYECEWQLLNTPWFLPQNRERVYFIGHLGDGGGRKVFPIGSVNEKNIEKCGQEQDICFCLNARDYKGVKNWGSNNLVSHSKLKFIGGVLPEDSKKWLDDGKEKSRNFPQGQRVYSTDGISAQLTSQGGGWGAKTGLYEVRPVLTPDREEKRQNGRRMKEDGEDAFTLTAQDQHGIFIDSKIRRLTPKECERLQGFPDGWTEFGLMNPSLSYIKRCAKKGCVTEKYVLQRISDSARYAALGNAVTVDVVEYIARLLKG